METSFKGGKIIVSDDKITYRTLFGTNIIQKRHISSVTGTTNPIIYGINFLLGLFFLITIFGTYQGYLQVTGHVRVLIDTTSGNHALWIKRSEVDAFKASI
jgi:hypothetical protein